MHNQQIPARRYTISQSTLQLPTGHYDIEDQNQSFLNQKDLRSHLIFCFDQSKYFLTRIDHEPLILVQGIPLCLKYNIKMKLNMYSVWHNYFFFYFIVSIIGYLLVSASIDPRQTSIYKNFKMLVHIV